MPVIIDGYNLLRAVQKTDEGVTLLDEAALCRVISEYLRRIRDHGHVFFDGTGPPDKSEMGGLGNVEVYFSGPNIEADDMIEEKILDCSAPKRLVVVSTDRRIRAAARKRKAISVRSEIFWDALIKQLDKQVPTKEPREKRHGITEGETDQWMDLFDIQ